MPFLWAETPRIIIPTEDPRVLPPVELSIRMTAYDFLVESEWDMLFEGNAATPGEFVFPLPPGAWPRSLRFEQGGKLVDAVFESRPPPVLQAGAKGSIETEPDDTADALRLSLPISQGALRVVLTWVQRPVWRQDQTMLRSALADLPRLKRFRLDLSLNGFSQKPTVAGPFSGLAVEGEPGRLRATMERFDFKPEGDLELTVTRRQGSRLFTAEDDDGSLLFVLSNVSVMPGSMRKRNFRPGKVAVLWDASASRAEADHARETALLASLLERWRTKEVHLRVLRDSPGRKLPFNLVNGKNDRMIAHIRDLDYDGGTDLGAVIAGWRGQVDAVLIFSDSIHSIGEETLPKFRAPVFAFHSGAPGKGFALEHMARQSGGRFFETTDNDLGAVVTALAAFDSRHSIDLEYDTSIFADVYTVPDPLQPGLYTITGHLKAGQDQGRLRLGFGARPWKQSSSVIIENGRNKTPLVRTYKAMYRAGVLSAQPLRNRPGLLDLAQRYGLQTPSTLLTAAAMKTDRTKPENGTPYRRRVHEEWQARKDFQAASKEQRTTLVAGMTPPVPKPSGIPVNRKPKPGSRVIRVKPRDPKAAEAYLGALTAAEPEERPGVYRQQRELYGDSPAFFLDCANFFLTEGDNELGLRIASNLVEQAPESPELVRLTANLYQRHAAWTPAVSLFHRLADLEPGRPQAFRELAMTYVARGLVWDAANMTTQAVADYRKALDIYLDLIKRCWESDRAEGEDVYDGLEQLVLVEYNWVLEKLKLMGVPQETGLPDPKLTTTVQGDLRVIVSWDHPAADIDLSVTEPGGDKVWYRKPRSNSGGWFHRDITRGPGPESYMLQEAVAGDYLIEATCSRGAGPGPVGPVNLKVILFRYFGHPNEEMEIISREVNPGETVTLATPRFEPSPPKVLQN
ncbi:MAG: hypothetical protein QNK37_01350 [Acidobacteriota bacterium]|nr:hypothetical protein [Acidobacteriota bacterium]